MLLPTYDDLIKISEKLEIKYELNEKGSLKLKEKIYPWSIKKAEFDYLFKIIKRFKLKKGYEVATGFGISSLAIGLALAENDGKLLTIDSYEEEVMEDPEKYRGEVNFYENSLGFKSIKQLVNYFNLQNIIFPLIGKSPRDVNKCLDVVFDKDEKLDFVFIDAGHWDAALFQDFSAIKKRLSDKCILAIHDGPNFSRKLIDHITVQLLAEWEFPEECKQPNGWDMIVFKRGF